MWTNAHVFWETVGGEDPERGHLPASLEELATVAASQAAVCRASALEMGRGTKQAAELNLAATPLNRAADAQVAAAASIAAAAQSLAYLAAQAATEAHSAPPPRRGAPQRVQPRLSQGEGSSGKGSSGKGSSSSSGKDYTPY